MFVCPECATTLPSAGPCPRDGATPMPRGTDGLLGTQLGAYRVAQLVGVGGMGRVYKGVHPDIGSRVAIKVLAIEVAHRPDIVERFFAEARAVNLIRHESLVNVLDLAHLPDGRPYIVMEFLDGRSLAHALADHPQVALGEAARIALEVLDALALTHARGIVHRDLKPDNLLLSPSGRTKILDFGIAKLQPDHGGAATHTGSLLGTPHYMSPEQAQAAPVDARTDLYAVGVILYEMVTGRRPFRGQRVRALARASIRRRRHRGACARRCRWPTSR
ncbi:MAG: serine/threonine-protein kinase [Kofleriaceae bacterium]